ncbi:MAG: hypothetical protein HUN04_16075 [Desulfobacter sp.]|nr:MAG: hypothetical protein HUN04_16075 [Desulfobacter sp.]
MKNTFPTILRCTRKLFLCTLPALACPSAAALAQVPGGTSPKIQPALILALALTSLVLFCIYLFQKHKTEKERTAQGRWTTRDNPFHTRLYETHKALHTLLDQPGIPMAKTALEEGRILDATPSLYRAMGYTKKEFLKQQPSELGILPTGEDDIRSLIENGWAQNPSGLCHRTTGEPLNCPILNIATHLDGHPTILSIVPGLAQPCSEAPAPSALAGYVDDFNKNRQDKRPKEKR